MQNRYVGDIGDFGKYGLLKALCLSSGTDDGPTLSLGVVWYLTPDESHNADGKHVRYLDPSTRNQEDYRICDPPLYDTLSKIVLAERRNVKSIREHRVLPPQTVYYEVQLAFDGISGPGPGPREQRRAFRGKWAQDAFDLTVGCDIVFVDPDKGLETRVRPYHKAGPQHVFFDELSSFPRRGQTLVIYHHIGRRCTAEQQIQTRLSQISERLESGGNAFALRFRRGSARVFFIVPAQRHRALLWERALCFSDGPWAPHFDLIPPSASLTH